MVPCNPPPPLRRAAILIKRQLHFQLRCISLTFLNCNQHRIHFSTFQVQLPWNEKTLKMQVGFNWDYLKKEQWSQCNLSNFLITVYQTLLQEILYVLKTFTNESLLWKDKKFYNSNTKNIVSQFTNRVGIIPGNLVLQFRGQWLTGQNCFTMLG